MTEPEKELEKEELEKRTLCITKNTIEELADTQEGERGYLVLYHPEQANEAYSVAKVATRENKKAEPNKELEDRLLKYLVVTPDIRIVPYTQVNTHDDEAESFSSAVGLYKVSPKHINLFLNIKQKKPVFFHIIGNGIYRSEKTGFKTVENNAPLKYEKRVGEIVSDISKLNLSGSI